MTMRKSTLNQGQILLKDEFEESASGHTEENEKVTLSANGTNKLLLNIYNASRNIFNGNKLDIIEENYEIYIDELINLIIKEGNKK